jgi:hypothetical protein
VREKGRRRKKEGERKEDRMTKKLRDREGEGKRERERKK